MSRPKKTSAKPQPAESTPKPQPAESAPAPQPAENAPAPQQAENAPKTSESSHGNELEQMIQNRVEKALSEKIQLEAYIKSETRAATKRVSAFIGVTLGFFSIAGFFCWDRIVDHVSTKAVARVANDVAGNRGSETYTNSSSKHNKQFRPRHCRERRAGYDQNRSARHDRDVGPCDDQNRCTRHDCAVGS